MRKLLLLLLAVASLAAAGALAGRAKPAATASQTVKITHTGYQPTSVSIALGDAVVFTDSDTVAHTVGFKLTTGMNCGRAVPFTLQPSQSATCTFASAGKFSFSDPTNKGKNFHGTVTVAKAAAVSLTAAPKAIVFGRKATLAGRSPVNCRVNRCRSSRSSVARRRQPRSRKSRRRPVAHSATRQRR
jgi:Plastocyanin